MSIFGVKRKHIDTSELKDVVVKTRKQVFTGIDILHNRIQNLSDRKIITIFAESKGSMQVDEVFSFGNGGRDRLCGYVLNYPGRILGIGLSTKKLLTTMSVVVCVNTQDQLDYGIDLNENTYKDFKNFDKPLNVKAGSIINFVNKIVCNSCENTIASAVIELFI